MLTCSVLSFADIKLDAPIRRALRDELTKPSSDFHRSVDTKTDGHIALVYDDHQLVAWCRTEEWTEQQGIVWDTLEAFVSRGYRHRGLAGFAACGLAAGPLYEGACTVAVFHPHMMLVAKKAGLWSTLFKKQRGVWRRV